MDKLQPLALSAEYDGVIADCVAGPKRHHRDLFRRPRADDTLASVNRAGGEVLTARLRNQPSECDRRAAWRVHLGPVMYLEHLGIEVRQDFRDLGDDLHQ